MARLPAARTRVLHRRPRARDRVWTSMRVLRRFTIPDLSATAECHRDNVRKFLKTLTGAGYLRVVAPRRSGVKGGYQVWMLIRNTGPVAPRLQSDGRLFDPNLHVVVEARHDG
jgi:hypothetical protein